jgi:hypothetical protein
VLTHHYAVMHDTHHMNRRSEATFRTAPTPTTQQIELILEHIARPSAAFRLARWTAHTPPASVSHVRGDIPAATVSRGAADGRATRPGHRPTIGCGLR